MMKLGDEVLKVLQKTYAPNVMQQARVKRWDLTFKTDDQGRPIQLFLGRADANGQIKGDRFARTLKFGPDGSVLKDHWERKGKAS